MVGKNMGDSQEVICREFGKLLIDFAWHGLYVGVGNKLRYRLDIYWKNNFFTQSPWADVINSRLVEKIDDR